MVVLLLLLFALFSEIKGEIFPFIRLHQNHAYKIMSGSQQHLFVSVPADFSDVGRLTLVMIWRMLVRANNT